MDISSWIGRHAAFSPRKTAIRFEGNQVSYGDFARQIGALAGVLHHRLGIRRGDRIAYLGQNHPDMLALLFACARLGAILMPMNWRLHRRELEQMLDDCGPSVLISDKTYNVAAGRNVPDMSLTLLSRLCSTTSAMHAHVPDSAGDAVLLCYTSGATGKPKGVVLDQHALLINALNSMHLHGLTAEDVVLTTLPMFHVGGLNILTLPILYAGGTLILHRVFDVDATFRALSDDKATLTVLVPTQIV
ncbi:MAG: class I adenylate-forming enzyme family protein, partial [Paracoccaceae bacterium]